MKFAFQVDFMSYKLTLKQIALHFNVPITTVSKALNDSYDMAVQLKKLLLKKFLYNTYFIKF